MQRALEGLRPSPRGSRSERTTEPRCWPCAAGNEKNMAGCWSSVRVRYLPSSTTPTTSARSSAPEFEVPADGLLDRAEDFHGELPVDESDAGRLFVVVEGQVPARQQVRAGCVKIARRDAVAHGVGGVVGGPEVGGGVGVDVGVASAEAQRELVDVADGGHAGNGRRRRPTCGAASAGRVSSV